MSEANTRGCGAFGAKFYRLRGVGHGGVRWFRRRRDAEVAGRQMAQASGCDTNDYRLERVTLTAKLTPKALALALLNGEEHKFIATSEVVED